MKHNFYPGGGPIPGPPRPCIPRPCCARPCPTPPTPGPLPCSLLLSISCKRNDDTIIL